MLWAIAFSNAPVLWFLIVQFNPITLQSFTQVTIIVNIDFSPEQFLEILLYPIVFDTENQENSLT